MIIIKTPEQIEGIRKSSKLAAETLIFASKFVREGTSTEELNTAVHKFILDHGAIPAPLNYNGFPKSLCTSINNVVCHGIPSPKDILKTGDIINLDITTILNGYYGDTSASYPVGQVDKKASQLLDRTRQSLDLAISALRPGKNINDCVGKVIDNYLRQYGYGIVRDLGGHGVGVKFHEDPFVYHFANRSDDTVLKPGMIFTIEPMVNASSDWQVVLDKNDGWTIRTHDGSLSAQFEHTVLITENGCEVLTRL
ncbi:type I methionyl aminopeptidase [Candidatus Shapirobacteria bacterium]|nr:type I methionyl aminopeptidase [Candidatus Shapirobacteria bacterium]